MKVYVGRWSELEMNGRGIEEFPSARMVAAETEEEALTLLGCPSKWFQSWFSEQSNDAYRAIALAKPKVVLESYVELNHTSEGLVRTVHWVPLDEIEDFASKMWKKVEDSMNQGANRLSSGAPTYNPFLNTDADELAKRMVSLIDRQ